jgi:hypothetical protein
MAEWEEKGVGFLLSTHHLDFLFCTTEIRLNKLCRVEGTSM